MGRVSIGFGISAPVPSCIIKQILGPPKPHRNLMEMCVFDHLLGQKSPIFRSNLVYFRGFYWYTLAREVSIFGLMTLKEAKPV